MTKKLECIHEELTASLAMRDKTTGKVRVFYYRCNKCKTLIDAKNIDVCPPDKNHDKLYAIQY